MKLSLVLAMTLSAAVAFGAAKPEGKGKGKDRVDTTTEKGREQLKEDSKKIEKAKTIVEKGMKNTELAEDGGVTAKEIAILKKWGARGKSGDKGGTPEERARAAVNGIVEAAEQPGVDQSDVAAHKVFEEISRDGGPNAAGNAIRILAERLTPKDGDPEAKKEQIIGSCEK